jgi:hypothetical protein
VASRKPRILYLVSEYPQISQSYVTTEIRALGDAFEVFVVTRNRANLPCRVHLPFEQTRDLERMVEVVRTFRPDVLHAHYVSFAPECEAIAARTGVPYTIRAHSFDAMADGPAIRVGDACLGVLAFPFTHANLEARGVPGDKLHDARPVVDFARFHDRGPNGDAILNVGACQPKKHFESYVDLARLARDLRFDLYAIGYDIRKIRTYNASRGSWARVFDAVQPEEMPAVYKAHRWLVYTACRKLATVGWPIAVAEAQAAGLGVCMPNLRPDVATYLGGAGFVYESIADLPDILRRPVPEEMRERGFEQARLSDIAVQKRTLIELWERAH